MNKSLTNKITIRLIYIEKCNSKKMNPVQIQKYTCNASIAFGKKKGHLNASQLKESQLARPDTRNRVIRSIYFLELKKKIQRAIYHDLS